LEIDLPDCLFVYGVTDHYRANYILSRRDLLGDRRKGIGKTLVGSQALEKDKNRNVDRN
jgi:hypothetical protein